jgi:sugar phosphate isomerase/epimerase
MSYQRAFSSLGCPELSLGDVQTLAQRHGLGAIELRALSGTIDLPAHFESVYGAPDKLAAQVGTGVRIIALDTSLKVVGGTLADREAFLRLIPWAEALGVRWLRVFDGGRTADPAEFAEAADTIQWWRTTRARHGWKVDIMVETHDSLFTQATIKRFLEAVPGVAILWDTHHTWKMGREDPVTTWRAIGPHVVHIHVKDSVSRPSAHHAHTYVLPGTGEFPMAPLRAVLQSEYAGPVSLEWEKLWHPYLSTLDEALTAATKSGWW